MKEIIQILLLDLFVCCLCALLVFQLFFFCLTDKRKKSHSVEIAASKRHSAGSPSLLSALVDVLFIASVSHVGFRLFEQQSAWTYATFFGHWIPLFVTYSYLESFSNRFSSLKWLVPLYFCVCFSWMGAAVNFARCHLSGEIATLQCSQFAFFVGLGRLVVAGGWFVAVLIASDKSQTWLMWKLLSCIFSSTLYFVCMFLSGMAWEILWFVAIGIDVVLLAVPNSFLWMDKTWPRFLNSCGMSTIFFFFALNRGVQSTEDRFGMVHVVSLAEVAIAIVLPRSMDNFTDILLVDRFTDVGLVLGLVFVLALWEFVVCESSRSLVLGQGLHALQVTSSPFCWLRKSVWMAAQFVSLSGVVIMSLVARTIGAGSFLCCVECLRESWC
jgi:hypothetical protein